LDHALATAGALRTAPRSARSPSRRARSSGTIRSAADVSSWCAANSLHRPGTPLSSLAPRSTKL